MFLLSVARDEQLDEIRHSEQSMGSGSSKGEAFTQEEKDGLVRSLLCDTVCDLV